MDNAGVRSIELLRRLTGNQNAEFRDGQREAITTVAVDSRRALVVQRTGWGKSAVYLIATRLLRDNGSGPTVIVSPLVALMRNQLAMASRLELHARTVLSSNREEWAEVFAAIATGDIDLLLISPERLNNPQFVSEVMPRLFSDLGLLVIDEVHCISDWGHDFRPDYRRLSRIVEALPPDLPILGTTATANDRVIEDVEEQLGSGLEVIRGTLERDSLALQVIRMPNKAERMAWLAATIPHLPGVGIVYCLTIADAVRVAEWLRSSRIDAQAYTGDMEDKARLEIEDRLSAGDLKVVVATSALAMGYDNPRIQFVIHYQTPGSPIAYYQQVGRAGRAVDRAYGIALSGWEDEEIQDYFIQTAFPSEVDTTAALDAMSRAGGLTLGEIEGSVNLRRSRIQAMLKILEVEGAVYRAGSHWFRSASRWEYPTERIAGVIAARRREQEAMREYVTTDACLMEFLRHRLDDPGATRCGRCANCVGSLLSEDVDPMLAERALATLRRSQPAIKARMRFPAGLDTDLDLRQHGSEPGRALTRWGDPGLAEFVRIGKYRDGRFEEDLVNAAADLVRSWGPAPRPTWLTWVPSSSGSGLLEDFAHRLGAALELEVIAAITQGATGQPQKEMQNGYQQARNVLERFQIVESRSEPVLLVDDMVDSGWTFTIVGAMLRKRGSGPVYPLALADSSTRSA